MKLHAAYDAGPPWWWAEAAYFVQFCVNAGLAETRRHCAADGHHPWRENPELREKRFGAGSGYSRSA